MVERIEKVTRVKGVDYDVSRPFERKEGYGDGTGRNGTFQQMLNKLMIKNTAETAPVADAYTVDIQRATQSLFYKDGLNLRVLGKDLYGG